MIKSLNEIYGLNVQEVTPISRKDTGNDNELFKVIADGHEYFVKEIPSHSKRDDLDSIYFELSKCSLTRSKAILPLRSLEGKFLSCVNGKDMMLYHYIKHNVFNDVDIEIDKLFGILEDLFTGLEKVLIPKHPFKTYSNWFERGVSQLRKRVDKHKFLDIFEDYTKTRFTQLDFTFGNTHFDLNPYNVWLDSEKNIMISDFDNAQVAAYAKDIFDACSKYLKTSGEGVEINKIELERILNFSKKYIRNIERRDVRFLLARPKLGGLFDPKSNYSKKELIKKMDGLFEFCAKSSDRF